MINMLEILNDEKSRVSFLKGLINLAKVTEISEGISGIACEEKVFLQNAMSALGLSESIKSELELFAESKEIDMNISFENLRQALFFLREGLQICYIEGKYQQAEKEMIEKFAQRLNISLETVDKIEAWVQEGIQWSLRGDTLLELEV